MPDAKISELTLATTLAAADLVEITQGGASKRAPLSLLHNALTANPLFPAGTAAAGSWPKMTPGALLTTPEAGALELDANAFYATTDPGNRGVVSVEHIIRQDAGYTLTSATTAQQVFNGSTNGRIALETGTYFFEALIALTGMSATSGNATFDLSGTATLGSILWHGYGRDAAGDAATGTLSGSYSLDATLTAAPLVTAGTATAALFKLEGTFEVTAAGAVQLRILLQTASAAVVAAGSFMRLLRVGSTTLSAVGQWD